MAQRKTLSSWLTTKYLLIIRNEENFEEKSTITFNYSKIVLILLGISIVFLAIAIYLVTVVMDRWFDPRYAQMVANRQVYEMSVKVDSLVEQARLKDQYIGNIENIVRGEDIKYVEVESEQLKKPVDEEFDPKKIDERLNPIDSIFRKEFEKDGLEVVNLSHEEYNDLRDLYFFTPIDKGIISDGFNPSVEHLGIDIVTVKDEPVKCIADGSVIFASWTMDAGYVIAIQHRSNLISVYKHNSELIKKVGNFVSAGEIIAIIGNTGEMTSGPHLHFEMWYNGNAIDPSDFIKF